MNFLHFICQTYVDKVNMYAHPVVKTRWAFLSPSQASPILKINIKMFALFIYFY